MSSGVEHGESNPLLGDERRGWGYCPEQKLREWCRTCFSEWLHADSVSLGLLRAKLFAKFGELIIF